jgi:multidrug efflux pump subunit AcrB
MEFEDLTREQLSEYAQSDSLICKMIFAGHPSLVVELLGDIGTAKLTANQIEERLLQARLAEIVGVKRQDDANHDETNDAIEEAVKAIDLAFEAALNAVEAYNETMKNCKCVSCQRRRGVASAESN